MKSPVRAAFPLAVRVGERRRLTEAFVPPDSWKQRSALSFGANTPQTPLRLFILQTLLLSLEVEEAVSTAVKGVGALSWVEEEARRIEPKREAEGAFP